MDNNKIDFVITWVDGNDNEWFKQKQQYADKNINNKNNIRYREWDNLQYWFRGVEQFTPWVNKIHFVTYGHVPKWLNIEHPKVNIVNHKDFIPSKYLPTFSSRPIELNMHKIKGLAKKFVYFNDDMFIIKKMRKEDFFLKGLPCDSAIFNVPMSSRGGIGNAVYNNMEIINDYFNKKDMIREHKFKIFNYKYKYFNLRSILLMPWKFIPGFYDSHIPVSYLKSTFDEVWEKENILLDRLCYNKFRTKNDVNHWLFRYWQLASGTFQPRNVDIGKLYSLTDSNQVIFDEIKNQRRKIICVNDNEKVEDFENQKKLLNETFNSILPKKSSFEI